MGPVSLVPDWHGKGQHATNLGMRPHCLQQCGACVSLVELCGVDQ